MGQARLLQFFPVYLPFPLPDELLFKVSIPELFFPVIVGTGKDLVRAIYYIVEQDYETGQAVPVTGGQVMLH
ncbi:MAG: hypothetical protein LBG95_06935 [Treponema sp.]|nr:hypothetical protein [Treponema sp.]